MNVRQREIVPVLSLDARARQTYSRHLAARLGYEYVPVAVGAGHDTHHLLSLVAAEGGRATGGDIEGSGADGSASRVSGARRNGADGSASRVSGAHGRGARGGFPDGVVLDVGGPALATEIIGALTHLDVAFTRLVVVVDPQELPRTLNGDGAMERHEHDGYAFYVPESVVLTSQLEYATAVVPTARIDAPTREFIHALNPSVEILERPRAGRESVPSRVESPGERIPGWLDVVNADLRGSLPGWNDVGVFRYVRERPFHPTRLFELLESETRFATLERIAGFARIVSRPGVVSLWDAVGETISIDPFQRDWWAEDDGTELEVSPPGGVNDDVVGQDIVAIGTGLDAAKFEAELDRCLVTDAEFIGGPSLWRTFEDSLP